MEKSDSQNLALICETNGNPVSLERAPLELVHLGLCTIGQNWIQTRSILTRNVREVPYQRLCVIAGGTNMR